MLTSTRLGATGLRAGVIAYRDALRSCSAVLDRLNVYPVPDGDTGKNMLGTVERVVAELEGAEDSLADVCRAIAYGSLMGASGNSGIILCQVLRGFTESLKAVDDAGPAEVAEGLTNASKQADNAVARPMEGTILSVVRASAAAAEEAAAAGQDLEGLLRASRAGAVEALARTPEQLPVLAQAGVVDAGGAGYCLFLDGLLHVLAGDPLPELPPVPEGMLERVGGTGPDAAAAAQATTGGNEGERDLSGLRYEVMFLLEADDDLIPAFKDVWSGIGDSIVVVGGDGLWNCHIHSDDIGEAIEAALDTGRPRRIKVTDLLDQVEEERCEREGATATEPADSRPRAVDPVPCAVVAVATGEGIRRIFHSLEVHRVVTGGQTMNPSTEDLLEAVEAVPADQVILLPNNKNIVPVAKQVQALSQKTVRVVPTTSVTEGFAALLDYDPQGDAEHNATCMSAAAHRVITGEITRSVRPSGSDAGPIAEGDWIGLSDDQISVVAPDLAECVEGLLAKLLDDSHEIVTLIEGDGATQADTRSIIGWLEERFPQVETEVHHGGQPLYPYLLSIE
ncbi:MAG: DAK2 domain-containing protein [Acidimicrobiales bacterium]